MSLSDVVRRAQKIVPIEDTPADDKLSDTMGGNPMDSFPSIRGESVQELDRIKHLAGLTMESARGLLSEYSVTEGANKDAMVKDAEKMSKAAFCKKYGDENASTWETCNED